MHEPIPESIFPAAALLCSTLGSVHDVRARRIPNLLTGGSMLAALLLHLWAGGWTSMAYAGLAGLLAGGATVFFFLVGGMGAGDVKLMTAAGCFVGVSALGVMLLATAMAGALFALVLAIRHGRLRHSIRNVIALLEHHQAAGIARHATIGLEGEDALRMPFAVPIAAGCMVTLAMQVWGGAA